jgi:hypothetical protein
MVKEETLVYREDHAKTFINVPGFSMWVTPYHFQGESGSGHSPGVINGPGGAQVATEPGRSPGPDGPAAAEERKRSDEGTDQTGNGEERRLQSVTGLSNPAAGQESQPASAPPDDQSDGGEVGTATV